MLLRTKENEGADDDRCLMMGPGLEKETRGGQEVGEVSII